MVVLVELAQHMRFVVADLHNKAAGIVGSFVGSVEAVGIFVGYHHTSSLQLHLARAMSYLPI